MCSHDGKKRIGSKKWSISFSLCKVQVGCADIMLGEDKQLRELVKCKYSNDTFWVDKSRGEKNTELCGFKVEIVIGS